MEMLWCGKCETNRKPSEIIPNYLGCDVCGLVICEFVPESPHPIHIRALNLGISHEYAIQEAVGCYNRTCGHFEFRDCKLVAAICLYIGCRANEISLMLYDLSVNMGVSVYHIGLMFLDVCEFLSCEIDGFKTPDVVDPVLFIHRFTFEGNSYNFSVFSTALRILASVKSDYVGPRKRLGGLCAAAVYMAGGFDMLDVDDVFTVFQALATENLVKCRILDLDHEFRSVAEEYKYLYGHDYVIMGNVDVLCPHNVEKFSHGFCHVCFVKLSGYFSGGSDAPNDLEIGIAVPRQDDLENGIAVSRQDDGMERLSSIINFDALRQVFGADVAQSTNTKHEEPNASSNAIEQGQARDEILWDESANGGAQGREYSTNEDDQREEVLVNKVRGRFGQPKRPVGKKIRLA